MVDAEGRLTGTITFRDLHDAAFDDSHDREHSARDMARVRPTALTADEDLAAAVRVFSTCGEAHLPVVRDRESMSLVGVAHEHKVMSAYHQALVQARAEERGEA